MKKHILICIIFLLIMIAITYPLIFKINSYISGFFSSDENYSPVWNAWWLKFCLSNNLLIKNITFIAYPFGMDYFLFGYLFFLINYVLAILTNPILTYNLQVILNFFLAALFTYLLVFSLTKERYLAFLSGVIFGFCPYIFVRSWQHLGETYLWMMPLVLWLLFRIREENSKKILKVFFVIGIILTGINLDAIYYILVILATFFIYFITYNFKKRKLLSGLAFVENVRYIKSILFLGMLAYFILGAQLFSYIKNAFFFHPTEASVFNPYRRPFEYLFEQSAKPLSYFLPAAAHPIFGKFTEQFVGSSLYGISFTEHTLYLGWTPLILAFVAFRRWRRKRKEFNESGRVPCGDSPYRENFYIGFFVFLAIVAWLFSQPPWWKIGPVKFYMPSFFMYKILPMVRAYCRFGIVLMLAVAVLAGFGLKFVLERFKSQKTKIVLTCLFSGFVLFEFWNWPPYKVIDVSNVPAVYYWLKSQPGDFAIAEYPLDADSPNEMYKFCQTKHEKKIINGTIPGTYANKVAQTIRKLSEPNTASILKGMGVKYTLVHRDDYLKTELTEEIEELNKIHLNFNLKLVKNFPSQECPRKDIMCLQKTGPINVYEVMADAQ